MTASFESDRQHDDRSRPLPTNRDTEGAAGPEGPEGLGEAEPIGPEGDRRPLRVGEEIPPLLPASRRTRRRVLPEDRRRHLTVKQRLIVLDTWVRSGLAAKDFAALVGLSAHTLYAWKRRFEEEGPAGLEDRATGRPSGSRMPLETRRAIVLMKQAHPEWGQDRIHDMLVRTEGFGASPGAIGRVLEEEGYVVEDVPTKPHAALVKRFERARPNQLWQTDLFTFVLKRQNRRVYMVVFMDDHSRFVVGYGLHASSSGALVREVLEVAIANFGAPEEILTDNGTQYHTWRGKSAFSKLLERRGIKQIVARPRHPQTLGKVERFWGTLWRECVERAVFVDLEDARRRIGLFIDHYNFQRTHSGIEGLVPADRYFAAAPQVLETLRRRVADRAKDLAQHGAPRKPFYLTGRVGGESISLHAEGGRVVLTKDDGSREEVDLSAPGRRQDDGDQLLPEAVASEGRLPDHPSHQRDPRLPPGASPLDAILPELAAGLAPDDDPEGDPEGEPEDDR